MENLVVGQEVTLNRDMMKEVAGAKGYVYEVYDDFDNPSESAVSIIFQNGSYDGFSRQEQLLFISAGRVDQRYCMYEFKNVNELLKDYKNGYWKF